MPTAAGAAPAGYEFITSPEFLRLEPAFVKRMKQLVVETPNEHRSEVILRLLSGDFACDYAGRAGFEPAPLEDIKRFQALLDAQAPKGEKARLHNPFVERLVRRVLAGCYMSVLKPEEARRVLEPLGCVRNWYGVRVATGGAAGLAVGTSVDRDCSLASEYQLGWRRGGWVPLYTGSPGTAVSVERLAGLEGGLLYLQAQIEVPTAFKGFLLLECGRLDKAALVRVDGLELARLEPSRQEMPAALYLPLELPAGWHRILVKTYDTRPALSCSFVFPDGRPFTDIVEETAGQEHECAGARIAGDIAAPQGAGGFYRALAENSKISGAERALAQATLSLLATCDGQNEAAYYHAVAAAELAAETPGGEPSCPAAHLALALAARAYKGLPESERRSRSAQALEKTLALAPDAALARMMLSEHLAQEDKLPEAFALLRDGLDVNPASLALHLAMLRVASEAEERLRRSPTFMPPPGAHAALEASSGYWFDLAHEQISALEALAPQQAVSVNARARFLYKRGLPAEAYRVHQAYAAARPTAEALYSLADAARRCGKTEAAIKIYRQLEEAGAGDYPQPDRRLTRLLAAAGEYKEAARRLEISCGQFPYDAGLRKRLAEVLEMLGDTAAAAARFEEALKLNPSDTSLRRYLRASRRAEPFYQRYQVDAGSMLKPSGADEPAAGASLAGRFLAGAAEADTERLVDQKVVRLYADGSYEDYTHEALRILTPKGVEKAKEQQLAGDEVIEVRTITPDGRVLEPNLRVAGGEATMPGLEPGAIVEYKVLGRGRGDSGEFDLLAWYFQDPDMAEPFLLSEYVLEMEKGLEKRIEIHKYQFDRISDPEPGWREGDGAADGFSVYRWVARDMSRLPRERLAPHVSRFLPAVHVRSRGYWERLAAELAARGPDEHQRPSRFIRETARKVLADAGIPDTAGTQQKVDALYRFVCRQVETGGDEDVAEAVLRAGSGERTNLLMALVRACGIEAYPAMLIPPDAVLSRTDEPFDWFSPRRLGFHCPVVMLEDGQPYNLAVSSPHQRYSPPGLFERQYHGGACLVSVNGVSVLLPIRPREYPLFPFDTSVEMRVSRDGNVAGQFVRRLHPALEAAAFFKRAFNDMEEAVRKVRVQQLLSDMFRGAEVEEGWRFSGSGPEDAFELAAAFGSRHLLAPGDTGLELKGLGLAPLNLVAGLVGSGERKLPYAFPLDRGARDRVVIKYDPRQLRVAESPAECACSLPFAFYSLSVAVNEAAGEAVVERRYNFVPALLPAAEYETVVRFCRRVDAAEKQRLLFAPLSQ